MVFHLGPDARPSAATAAPRASAKAVSGRDRWKAVSRIDSSQFATSEPRGLPSEPRGLSPGETLDVTTGATRDEQNGVYRVGAESFVDIHCHLVPGIDDGARDWDECLAMARLAVAEGIGIAIATPHQCGSYARNDGDTIRRRVAEVQQFLDREGCRCKCSPGETCGSSRVWLAACAAAK